MLSQNPMRLHVFRSPRHCRRRIHLDRIASDEKMERRARMAY
jgi:hypothetical protein